MTDDARITGPCADCGLDTLAAGGDYYMIHGAIWQKAWPDRLGGDDHYLCISCLAQRLGRDLARHDFTQAPVNRRSKIERLLYFQATRC